MSITLSEKHGVNPSIPTCYYCLEEKNETVLFGRLPGDEEAGMHCGVIDYEPCDKCRNLMEQGILLISVRNGEMEREQERRKREENEHRQRHGSLKKFVFLYNPYRTGGWAVVTTEYIRNVVNEPMLSELLERRWTFIDDDVWDKLGMPRNLEEANKLD